MSIHLQKYIPINFNPKNSQKNIRVVSKSIFVSPDGGEDFAPGHPSGNP